MQNYLDKNTVCPFYSQQDNLKIHCEGYSKGNRIQISFENKYLMKEHKKRFCNNIKCYRQCPLYPIIEKQYKDGGNDE